VNLLGPRAGGGNNRGIVGTAPVCGYDRLSRSREWSKGTPLSSLRQRQKINKILSDRQKPEPVAEGFGLTTSLVAHEFAEQFGSPRLQHVVGQGALLSHQG